MVVVAAAKAAWAVGGDESLTGVGMDRRLRGPTLGLHTARAQKVLSLCWVRLTMFVCLCSQPLPPSDLSTQAYGLKVLGWV